MTLTQRQRRERRAVRRGTLSVRALDYRYGQCRRCGWDPEDDEVWHWWRGLHYRQREQLVLLTPAWMLRDQ